MTELTPAEVYKDIVCAVTTGVFAYGYAGQWEKNVDQGMARKIRVMAKMIYDEVGSELDVLLTPRMQTEQEMRTSIESN